jgi:hypothetical protein
MGRLSEGGSLFLSFSEETSNSMNLDRADSKRITAEDRHKALAAFELAGAKPLAVGTEAEVYERNNNTLLKLYAGDSRLNHLKTLKEFYENLDSGGTNLSLPRIHEILQYGNLIASIESRIEGAPMEALLDNLNETELEEAENLYLDAVFRLKNIRFNTIPKSYLLFDQAGISDTSKQGFESFYAGFLEQKIQRVGRFFESTYPKFSKHAPVLVTVLRNAKACKLSVVHGDIFPGNLLVDKELTHINGVIDFGSFTLFGNYLLDIAGAFGFWRMYHPQRKENRAAMLPKILFRLANDEKPVFFQFLLAHAILTSDLYASNPDPRGDGHFDWAAEIVATDSYWEAALRML